MGLGRQRSQRLTNGLADLRRSNQLLEELLAWLNGAEVTLTEVEQHPIPNDMAIIQQLLKEHQVCATNIVFWMIIEMFHLCWQQWSVTKWRRPLSELQWLPNRNLSYDNWNYMEIVRVIFKWLSVSNKDFNVLWSSQDHLRMNCIRQNWVFCGGLHYIFISILVISYCWWECLHVVQYFILPWWIGVWSFRLPAATE